MPRAVFAGPASSDFAEKAFVYSRWETITEQDGLPGNDIRAIRTRGDRIWVGTDKGLARRDHDGWAAWTVRDGLPASTVTAIDVDPVTDEVWLGTWGCGLVRFSAGRMDGFNQRNSGLAGDLVLAVLVDGDRVWVASNGGINKYRKRDAAWDLYDPRRADVSPGAVTSFVLNKGSVFAAAWCAGIRRFDLQRHALSFPRTAADGAPVSSVAIGLFGPRTKTIPLPGRHAVGPRHHETCDLTAAQLTIDGANRRGGYRRRTPYDLVLRPLGYANYGWGLPEDDLPGLASREDVVGIVGLIEPDDRLTDLVAFRTKVPVVNVGSGSSSDVPSSGNPWVFRCMGDRPQRHRGLLDMLFDRQGFRRPAVLCSGSPEVHRRLDWWNDHATRRGYPLVATVTYDPDRDDLDAMLHQLDRSTPDVLLAPCDARVAAAVVRRMRTLGMNQLFVGTSAIVNDAFIEQVGLDAEPVCALYASRPPRAGKIVDAFSREYAERNAIRDVLQPPPPRAYRTMDALGHLLAAIERAGPDREAVREELARMSRSAEGEAQFEQTHEVGEPVVAWLRGRHWRFEPIE